MFRNKHVLALAVFVASAASALSQVAQTGAGKATPSGGGGSGYVGPANLVASASAWWGLRAYSNTLANSGVSTTPIADVTGATTSTSCTIYLKGNGTGDADLTTSGAGGVGHQCSGGATTFCTVTNTNCTIAKLYDQTVGLNCAGSCDLIGSGSTLPKLVFSGLGSLPIIDCTAATGGNQLLAAAASIVGNQPLTFVAATEVTNGAYGGGSGVVVAIGAGTIQTSFVAGLLARMYAGSVVTVAATVSTWYAFQGVFNGGSSALVLNGSATTVNPGSNNSTGALTVCNINGGGAGLAGNIAEAGVWPVAFNSTQYAAMNSNMRTYWGF